MASGSITTLQWQPLAGMQARSTDHSAQMFIKGARSSQDVGYVTANKKIVIWMWNGAPDDVVLTGIVANEQANGITTSATPPDIIPTQAAVQVVVTVTIYGPLEYEALLTFLPACAFDPTLTITGTRPLFSIDQPPPITLDAAIAEAYAEPDPGDTFYDTLEFLDSASGEKLLIVYSDEDLETPQGTFTACKFGCKHPETEGGVVGAMQITVDFLPKAAQRWIMETCKARGKVTVYWRQYLGPGMEPDAHYPIPLDITSVEQTTLGATVNASFPMLTAMKFPRRLMTTSVLPGGLV